MSRLIFAFLFACIVGVVFSTETSTRYTNKYSDFDIDSVLNNEKILKNYIKCLLSEGPCTREGRELQRVLPEAIKTECSKCDDKQKAGVIKVLRFLDEKHPELLKKILRKFDPTGENEKRFREKVLKQSENSTTAAAAAAGAISNKPSKSKSV